MPLDQYGGENGMVGYSPAEQTTRGEDRKSAGAAAGAGAAKGAASGAALGASVGSVVPVIGNAVGAVVGTVLGAIGGALGGGIRQRRKNRRNRKKERAWDEAQRKLAEERYQARVQAHQLAQLSYSPANALMKEMYGKNAGFDLSRTPWGQAPAAAPTNKGSAAASGASWSPAQYDNQPARGKPTGQPASPGRSTTVDREKPEGTDPPRRPQAR